MRKDIREKFGISQIEMAKLVGVSRSTVQRFEYGTGNNPKIKAFYENMEKNVDLIDEFTSLRRQTVGRLRNLHKENLYSPAESWLESKGYVPDKDYIGDSRRALRKAIGIMNDFLDMKTSTTEGAKDWHKNVEEASMETSQSGSREENDMFWKLFNRLKHNNKIKRYWGTGDFDSKQAVEDIKIVMIYRYAGYETVDELYDILIKGEF